MQFQFDQLCYHDIEQQALYCSEYFDNPYQPPKQPIQQDDNISDTSSEKSISEKLKDFGEIILNEGHTYEQEFLQNHRESLDRFNQKAQRVQNALDRFSNKIINFFNKNENKNDSQ